MIEKLNLNKKEFTDEEIISLLSFAELSLLNLPEKEKVKVEKIQADLVNREDSVSDEEIISLLGSAELSLLNLPEKEKVKIEKIQADLVSREDSASDEEIISLLGSAELEILQQRVKPRFASGAGKLKVTMILSSEKDLENNYCPDRVEMQGTGE